MTLTAAVYAQDSHSREGSANKLKKKNRMVRFYNLNRCHDMALTLIFAQEANAAIIYENHI